MISISCISYVIVSFCCDTDVFGLDFQFSFYGRFCIEPDPTVFSFFHLLNAFICLVTVNRFTERGSRVMRLTVEISEKLLMSSRVLAVGRNDTIFPW